MLDCLIKAESFGPKSKDTKADGGTRGVAELRPPNSRRFAEGRAPVSPCASAKRNERPGNFPIHDFKPRHAWRRTAVWSSHAAGIQKQNISAAFISWHVRVPVQKNVDIVRRFIRRNVLKSKFYSTAHKIDDQWPFEIAVAVSAYVSDPGSNRAKLVEKAFHANISKVPDLVCTLSQFLHVFRQPIVRVR
jgi:hypothetical protein